MPGFPAVGDLGQDLTDTFDIGVSPEIDGNISSGNGFGWLDFSRRNVRTQRCIWKPKFFGRLV